MNSTENHQLISVVLPQFHPIPENDAWWGRGFTEWTNVARATSLFQGHQQPQLPADLGFYDLRLPEARLAQADLARQYGITGFCYYHYWFSGRQLLERPVQEIITSGEPDFPFCLCWANEPWSRRWNGSDKDVLMPQSYSTEDDIAHFHSLLPALRDPRYIRIEGRPLLIVYRLGHMDAPQRTFDCWRRLAEKEGLGQLMIGQFESFEQADSKTLGAAGVDLSIEFAPDWRRLGPARTPSFADRLKARISGATPAYWQHTVSEYSDMVLNMSRRETPDYQFLRCVTPGFDNSARKKQGANILAGSTPELYGRWLEETLKWTTEHSPKSRQVVFINAWNEWAEGNHLEPCQHHGLAYLQATADARRRAGW